MRTQPFSTPPDEPMPTWEEACQHVWRAKALSTTLLEVFGNMQMDAPADSQATCHYLHASDLTKVLEILTEEIRAVETWIEDAEPDE